MTQTFDDEFQGPALDTSKWTAVAAGGADTINNEQQAYLPSSVQILPGNGLRLQANNVPFWTQNYRSGEITGSGHFSQAYGHFEMKAKMPNGNGLWPAFWLLPANGSWPPEIDIVEYIYAPFGAMPSTPDTTSSASQGVHWNGGSPNPNLAQGFTKSGDFGTDYHTYGIDWRPGTIVFMVDGAVQGCLDNSAGVQRVPDTAMYMIANLAIGPQNSWSGSVTPNTIFPANMDIAYIRAYKFNDVAPAPPEPLLVKHPGISRSTVYPGDTIEISADVVAGTNLPGPTNTQFFVENYDGSRTLIALNVAGPQSYQAGQSYHYAIPYTIPSDTPPGIYTVAVGAFYNNWSAHQWFPQNQFPPITVVPYPSSACGTILSGSTGWQNNGTSSSTSAATLAQCPYGGTVTTTWTNQIQMLCTNGKLSSTGQTQKTSVVANSPACTAPVPCGSQPSGQTWNKYIKSTFGTATATTVQCPYGGTVTTQTDFYQNNLCTNGILTPVGAQTSTTVVATWAAPVCNPKPGTTAPCGDQPSGQTWGKYMGSGYGSASATPAQCPYGGTITTWVNYYQNFLCTNGTLVAVGAQTSQSSAASWISPQCNVASK